MQSSFSALNTLLIELFGGRAVDREAAVELSRAQGPEVWDVIALANRVRERHRGPDVDICSIVNAKSGACSEDCKYCAQSAHHATSAQVYPLIDPEQMTQSAESARRNGANRFCIVTSGRGVDTDEDLRRIAQGIARVKDLGLKPCATLGTLTRHQLALLRDAGLHRYHHNIETSRNYFPNICTTHSFDERISVLKDARSLGLSICSGGILGMGESLEDRIDMAFTLRELNVDSVPLNFLMPIAGTPLGNSPSLPPLEALLSIALFRLILSKKEIRICGGRTMLGSLHPLIFAAGADGFMIGNYLTQSGRKPADDLAMLRELCMKAKA
jgi:biotin synthase